MNGFSQLDGESVMAPTYICRPDGRGLNIETIASSSSSIREKAASPALALQPDISASISMSLASFDMCCSSAGALSD